MYDGEELTYAEVGRRIARVQEILCGAGLRAGDKVALLSSNMPNWGVCYYAVTAAGMIVVPILPDFSGEELDMIIEHSEARALLVSDRLFTKLSRHTIERLNVVVRTKTWASSRSGCAARVPWRCLRPMTWPSSSIRRARPPGPRA